MGKGVCFLALMVLLILLGSGIAKAEAGGDWRYVLDLLNNKRIQAGKDPINVSHPEDIDMDGVLAIQQGITDILGDYGFTGSADALNSAGYAQTTWSEGFDCKNEILDILNLMYVKELSAMHNLEWTYITYENYYWSTYIKTKSFYSSVNYVLGDREADWGYFRINYRTLLKFKALPENIKIIDYFLHPNCPPGLANTCVGDIISRIPVDSVKNGGTVLLTSKYGPSTYPQDGQLGPHFSTYMYSTFDSCKVDLYPILKYAYHTHNQKLPTASFTYSPENPVASEEITFDASSSSDPDGQIVSYEWDFGDGKTTEGMQVNHAYQEAGNYTVILTVTDNDGLKDSLSKILHVEMANMTIHGKISVPDGVYRPLIDVKVILELLNGQSFVSYTDEEGNYIFSDIPMLDFNITVELEDKDGIIKIYDSSISNSDVFYLKTKTITPETQDQELDIVFHESSGNLFPGMGNTQKQHLDDNGVIYYYTQIARDFAEKALNLTLNHAPPVGVYGWTTQGTWYTDTGYGGLPASSISIDVANSDINSGNKPDNREWHEFSHHIMTDSIIGGNNLLPPATGSNHGGYKNNNTAYSWIEGFAEFLPLTITDYLGLPNPSFYGWGRRDDDLEENYEVWQDEEFAIAGILWDLYDGESGTDRDAVDLTLDGVWNLLNRQNNLDLKALYDTLSSSGIIDLSEDFNNNSLSDLDEIFISHGAFNDLNDNRVWDPGEGIGYTGNSTRPHRRNKPPRNDSYLLITVIDNFTGEFIDELTFLVTETKEPPFDIYNREYNFTESGLPGKIFFTMSPYPSIANITTEKGCYISSDSLTITSSFYWDNINTGKGYLMNHTFYMIHSCLGDATKDCQVNIFDLAAVGLAYGSQPGNDNWNPDADLTGDEKINIFDLATVGLNYGRIC